MRTPRARTRSSCTPRLPGSRLSYRRRFGLAIGVAASFWVVQRLGQPTWWLLFPPLVHAMWNGEPQTLMLALLVTGIAVAGALAAIVKLYALLPLAFHPRRLLTPVVVLLITVPLLPWQLYVEHGLGVGSHLNTAWNGSAWRLPLLVPPVVLALWVLRQAGRRVVLGTGRVSGNAVLLRLNRASCLVGRPWLAAALRLPSRCWYRSSCYWLRSWR